MANKDGEVQSKELRVSQHPDEMYAVVVKNYGNGRSEIRCDDGQTRMLFIPKKFRGRNRWQNLVAPEVIVLAGFRSYEKRQGDGKEKCDLLYVYDEHEVYRLRQSSLPIAWKNLQMEGRQANFDELGFTMEKEGEEVSFDFNAI